MQNVKIIPSTVHGTLKIPPSKSQTMRALIFALMAKGKSTIYNSLQSPDVEAMAQAIEKLGAQVHRTHDGYSIEGTGGNFRKEDLEIDCRNSGQVLRFLGSLATLSHQQICFTGDPSIQKIRPVQPLIGALNQLGAKATSDGAFPLIVQGPKTKTRATLSGEDSQPISGLLLLGAFSPIQLRVINPGEIPWVQLTLSWLDRFQIPYRNDRFTMFETQGGAKLNGFEYRVASDLSSMAFPLALTLLSPSSLILDEIELEDGQGDQEILSILESMNAVFQYESKQLSVPKQRTLQGTTIDINGCIDALPILAVIGCFARGKTEIVNGAIARKKESDRIHTITMELQKMGAHIEEKEDGLVIYESKLKGNHHLNAHQDHRIAMALTIAGLCAEGNSTLLGVECVAKSYPTFFTDLRDLGANLVLYPDGGIF